MESVQSTKSDAPELNLDELMEKIRAEVAERKRAAAAVAAGSTEWPASLDRPSWTARELLELATRIESLEKRAAEAAAAIRSIRSVQLSDRQTASNQVGLVREQLSGRLGTLVARFDALDDRIGRSLGGIESRMNVQFDRR